MAPKYCRAEGCRKPGPWSSQKALKVHQSTCEAVANRTLKSQNREIERIELPKRRRIVGDGIGPIDAFNQPESVMEVR